MKKIITKFFTYLLRILALSIPLTLHYIYGIYGPKVREKDSKRYVDKTTKTPIPNFLDPNTIYTLNPINKEEIIVFDKRYTPLKSFTPISEINFSIHGDSLNIVFFPNSLYRSSIFDDLTNMFNKPLKIDSCCFISKEYSYYQKIEHKWWQIRDQYIPYNFSDSEIAWLSVGDATIELLQGLYGISQMVIHYGPYLLVTDCSRDFKYMILSTREYSLIK